MAKPSKNKHLQKLLDNIEKDRVSTEKLLEDVSLQLLSASNNKKEDFYRNMGPVAGKYLEVLQKINEQHMKAISSIEGKEPEEEAIEPQELHIEGASGIIGSKEMDNIYESIERNSKN